MKKGRPTVVNEPRFYNCRVPSLGRRTTVPATDRRQAVAATARLWKVPTHRVVVVFAYPGEWLGGC